MENVIYQLHYNYKNDNGNYIEFGQQQELTVQHMAAIQVRMLQSNTIPKLLPATFEQMDMQMKIRYDIGSRTQLLDTINIRGLSESDYYGLLYGIASALDDSGKYMLMEEHFILDEQLIYIGSSMEDVYLTYLPFQSIPDKPGTGEAFKQLCLRLIGHVKPFQGYGFQPMMELLSKNQFRWSEMKQLLHAAKHGQTSAQQSAAARMEAPAAAAVPQPIPPLRHESVPSVKAKPRAAKETPASSATAADGAAASAAAPTELPPLTQREKIYLYAIAVLGAAAIWKWYLDVNTEPAMLVALGVTVLCVNLVYTYAKVYRPNFAKMNKPIGGGKTANAPLDVEARNAASIKPVKQKKSKKGKELPQELSAKPQLTDQTVLLTPVEETVLLNGIGIGATMGQPTVYLEITKDGHRSELGLNVDRYMIGRDADQVNYVDDTVGVSRTHVELLRMGSEYMAKDLGSKNGTTLNGETMVPFKMYVLKEGDTFRTVKTEFTFHIRG
ncbi:FHA domain-containing protein [Paenibacillus sp. ACRRX]|uniref:DUF6382 domain-containing protein n=1 Tax=Paenibacillus sp. ACRRX TaxID=2918206 RepID=UPI001EF67035|nr:DUF6382 domain-containing protein [Paenibacillus sp. ACRRX]MCG7409159.1 FHA domain-containing protein [Paenibacillus sp. ACRRX]